MSSYPPRTIELASRALDLVISGRPSRQRHLRDTNTGTGSIKQTWAHTSDHPHTLVAGQGIA